MTRRFLVSGRVQGVGFRWFAGRIAEAFDIRGWVRNADDGSVEILACGTPENLRSFKEQIEIGPTSARVDRVEDEERPEERFDGFIVKR
ncbi:MAG TPA: acylphosphatase [Candidatus Kapabacteria bacterium]|jgi:acylphosphatase|nr:acylphosphatase [Candidatus Kapabacteria bacterium]